MPHIQQLSPHVADLIAAGEVVERPASVVKELLENAIDAGAQSVTVEMKNGGMTYLRVSDDGCGIAPSELPTAFLRHATSKLRTAEDLAAIGTLGFRGEALAAISSVSRLDIFSRERGALSGAKLHLEGGVPGAVEDAGCPEGTSIIVRDLFYNTPARLKFMKRDSAEATAIAGLVGHLALSGLFALVERGHDRVVNEIKHALFAHELHDGLRRVDVHVHHVARQLHKQHAAGELALHHAVCIGFLERGGQELGLDQTSVDEKGLHPSRAAAREGLGHKAVNGELTVAPVDLDQREGEIAAQRGVDGAEGLAGPALSGTGARRWKSPGRGWDSDCGSPRRPAWPAPGRPPAGLQSREKTLRQILGAIVKGQRDFFLKGAALAPLTMQQVAEELGLSTSTVSRAVKDKYLSFQGRSLALRSFFVAALPTGEGVSPQTACEHIRRHQVAKQG